MRFSPRLYIRSVTLDEDELVRKANRIKDEFVSAIDRGDLDEALQIGVERLMPVGYELLPDMTDVGEVTAAAADDLVRKAGDWLQHMTAAAVDLDLDWEDPLTDVEEELLLPTAALIPESIEIMGRLDSVLWAVKLRRAAGALRELSSDDLEMLDRECRASVWLARLHRDAGEVGTAIDGIKDALLLWIRHLDSHRYWSGELRETWTVAAEVLDSLGRSEAAVLLRRAIHQATAGRQGALTPSVLASVLDLRPHYEAALAAL